MKTYWFKKLNAFLQAKHKPRHTECIEIRRQNKLVFCGPLHLQTLRKKGFVNQPFYNMDIMLRLGLSSAIWEDSFTFKEKQNIMKNIFDWNAQ